MPSCWRGQSWPIVGSCLSLGVFAARLEGLGIAHACSGMPYLVRGGGRLLAWSLIPTGSLYVQSRGLLRGSSRPCGHLMSIWYGYAWPFVAVDGALWRGAAAIGCVCDIRGSPSCLQAPALSVGQRSFSVRRTGSGSSQCMQVSCQAPRFHRGLRGEFSCSQHAVQRKMVYRRSRVQYSIMHRFRGTSSQDPAPPPPAY